MPRPQYDLESLKANVKRCDETIARFQGAIQKEMENKAQLLALIREIEDGNSIRQGKQDNNG